MNASDYQKAAARTLITNPGEFTNDEIMLIWGAMGLAGEAGEVVELIKKGVFHRHGLDRDKLKKELGDVLWYVASICTVQGFDMGEIMAANIEKLATRYPNGFSTADSVKRVDVDESIYDICKCGHSRKDHSKNTEWKPCWKENLETGETCPCSDFTWIATVAHAAPVEMCECGHDESWHNCDISASHPSACTYMHNKGLFGGRGCKCLKHTPIPAPLNNGKGKFEQLRKSWICSCGEENKNGLQNCWRCGQSKVTLRNL